MTDLKSCPFCGGEADITKTNYETWISCEYYDVFTHQVSIHARTEAEAIAAWNARADDRSEAADYWRRMYEESLRERTCKMETAEGGGRMSVCEHCARAEFRGYPPKGSPEWEVGTVSFWCPTFNTHHQHRECEGHVEGVPAMFDKRGRRMEQ